MTERRLFVIIHDVKRKLTPKFVEHVTAPSVKRFEVWDTALQCFGIRVSPTGRKVWFVVVRVDGRQRRMTIGTYPALSLAEARDQARKLIRDAQLGRLTEKHEELLTLGDAVPLFVQLYAKPKNKGWKEADRLLRKFQSLFARPLTQIKRSDVVRVLDDVVASGTPYRANRALAALKKLMSWSLDRGVIEVNPIAGLKPPHKERSRERILSDAELVAFLDAAESEAYPFGTAFTILLLTGQRRGEVAEMRWSEIDLDGRVWTIPAHRAKNAQRHTVPLSPPALEILRVVPRFAGSDYVFTTTGQTPISGFGRVKYRLDCALGSSDWRTHDLRRTVASGLARLGIEPHVIEKVLNHRSGIIAGVAAVYNRYAYEQEKRAALDRWAAYCYN